MAPNDPDAFTHRAIKALVETRNPHAIDEDSVALAPQAGGGQRVRLADWRWTRSRLPSVGSRVAGRRCRQARLPDARAWSNRRESINDHAPWLQSPKKLAGQANGNGCFVPSAWNKRWASLRRRAASRHRRPHQTRHTDACWTLAARGDPACIANRTGHSDHSMLVKVGGRCVDTESPGRRGASGRA